MNSCLKYHINPYFKQTDVVIAVGANDVINPTREDQNSPIWHAYFNKIKPKRGYRAQTRFCWFAESSFHKNTIMLYGDAKQTVIDLAHSLKEAS